jgi:hypothetical protein
MKNYQFNKVHDEFGKKVLAAIPQVFPYVKHRLYVAETKGIMPRNMYKTNGIIDDAIIDLYKKYEGKLDDVNEIKLKLFMLSDKRINLLLKKEAFHKNTLSTSQILKNELKLMEEKFEFDAGNDLIMHEELDDISYQQDNFKKPKFLYNDAEKNIVKYLEIPKNLGELTEIKRKALNQIYHWLPTETSNILDLFIFGKLTYDEIALIKEIDVYEIKSNIQEVSTVFRKNVL